jgi:predicted transcriptional regulator of viral defense system
MKTTDILIDKINRLPIGYIFTYDDFYPEVDKPDALIKALSRLVQDGKIRKLSPGRFYKPRFTDFGELSPETYQVVKDLLTQNGKITGYLTGYSAYNQLGLTRQVSSIIQIGSNEPKKNITRGIYQIRFIKQYNTITKGNIPLLRMLDAISKIKEIPDSSVDHSCGILSKLIKQLGDSEKESLIKLAKKYQPSTRALTGALLENIFGTAASETLYKSLNPSTKYQFGLSQNRLPNKQKWRIR